MTSLTGKQDRVKLAIQSQPLLGTKQPLLLEVANNSELVTVIRDICGQWAVSNPEQYALKYAEPAAGHATAKFGYITESNRQHLKNGDILTVAKLPTLAAKDTFDKICSTGEEKKTAMAGLVSLSKDYVFALEFISLKGVQQLMAIVEQCQLGSAADVDILMSLSEAFQELMQHNIVSWEALTENFVKKLINFIEMSNETPQNFQPSIVSMCLDILQSTMGNSPKFYELVLKHITINKVMPFLDKPHNEVKRTTLAFINVMISKAPNKEAVFKELYQFGMHLKDSVLSRFNLEAVPREIAQELYVYQCHLMNQYESRMKQKFFPGDAQMEEDLHLLPARAFQDDSSRSKSVTEGQWKQLGFLKGNDPRQELMESPPGILALDCMVHFARNKHDLYSRFVLVHAENMCPFAYASIALTKVLCQIFRVGEPPIELAHEFIPLIVASDDPLKDLFVATIQLLLKTWKEMRASVLDMEKVMVVVTKQILTLLQSSTATLTTFDVLKTKLFELTYKKIIEAEENSQLLDESVLKSKPVQELSDAIRPEIVELVKQERLRHLVEGATFPKIGRRGRDQLFCCRLSPNYKMLHFGDISGEQVPPLEALDKKIPVSEMKLEVGMACPHADKVRRGGGNQSLFSIFYEENEHLDFIAPNETVYNIWVDGLSVLLNRKMTSKAAEEDIETLLNMDLKLRLLDIENVSIPNQTPTIPKEPLDYDFFYKLLD